MFNNLKSVVVKIHSYKPQLVNLVIKDLKKQDNLLTLKKM